MTQRVSDLQGASAVASRMGISAVTGLKLLALAAVAAGAVSIALGELRPAAAPAAIEQVGQLQYRPTVADVDYSHRAFELFRDKPETTASTRNGQTLAMSGQGL